MNFQSHCVHVIYLDLQEYNLSMCMLRLRVCACVCGHLQLLNRRCIKVTVGMSKVTQGSKAGGEMKALVSSGETFRS